MRIIRNPEDASALSDDHPAHARLDLLYLAPIVIIEPGDTEADIVAAIGFSPLVNRVDGARYPSPSFDPSFEYVARHDGWYELVFVTSDDGSGVILLTPDRGAINTELISLCRTYAEPADPSDI